MASSKTTGGVSGSSSQRKGNIETENGGSSINNLSKTSNRIRAALGESEFIVQLNFRNTLPPVPSGPFFKKIDMAHTFEDFSLYKTSSIEKSYVWQPHFGADANLRLDLVDQDAILNMTDETNDDGRRVKKEIKEYYERSAGSGANGVDVRKKETRQKHWWLRETVYSENNILKNRSASNLDGAKATSSSLASNSDSMDPFTVESIQQSFENMKEKMNELILADNVEWSLAILPDMLLQDKQYSYINFVEDPHDKLDGSNATENVENCKKRKLQSIVTNIRESKSKKGSGDHTFAASLIVPSVSSSDIDSNEAAVYEWISDYQMVMKNKAWRHHYVFALDQSNSSANYFPVGVNMEMGKLQIDEVDPHNASVERRLLEEEDNEEFDSEKVEADDVDSDPANREPDSIDSTEMSMMNEAIES